MPIACINLPNFALRVAVLDRPELDGMSLVLHAPPGARPIVVDCTPEAVAQGIRPGLAIREVSALAPEAVIIHPNPAHEAAVFERIVTRLEALSPLVEPGEPGICYVDLSGLERHYGSVEGAARRLLQAAPPILRPRVGIAEGKFTARVAAQQAAPGAALSISPAETASFLSRLPVEYLPLPIAMRRRLEQLGLRRLGDLRKLAPSALEARFGPDGRRAWELASGRDDAQVQPRRQQETVVERIELPAPATSREMLLIAIQQLVVRAFGRPSLQGRQVREARLIGLIEDNRSWEHRMALRHPVDGPRLIEALGHRLQAVELPGPLESLTLELTGLVAEVARQEILFGARPRRGRQVIEAIRQLKQRYGRSPIYHVVEVEPWSRIPERRRALISYDP